MSQSDVPPDGESPSPSKFANLVWHLLLVAATCAGFGLGLAAFRDRPGRVVVAFAFAVMAHFAVLAVYGAIRRWTARAVEKGDR